MLSHSWLSRAPRSTYQSKLAASEQLARLAMKSVGIGYRNLSFRSRDRRLSKLLSPFSLLAAYC